MLLLRVGAQSAGNYSCSSHKSNSATVSINVVDGEHKPKRPIVAKIIVLNLFKFFYDTNNMTETDTLVTMVCVISRVAHGTKV